MSLYDRFRSYDDDLNEVAKLPIWPTITTVAEILSGEISNADAIARFNLDADEQAEFEKVKVKVLSDIADNAAALTSVGIGSDIATTIARAVVRNTVTQTLMRAELSYCTRSEFNTALGIL